MSASNEKLLTTVFEIAQEAQHLKVIDLRPVDQGAFIAYSAGAHIDLHLGDGLIRSYSLINPSDTVGRYLVAVKNERDSRGGSRFIHDQLKEGDQVEVSKPRNTFPLVEDAAHSIMIAGGIGVTPLVAMTAKLNELGRSWELHYAASRAEQAGFAPLLSSFGDKVTFYFPTATRPQPAKTRIDLADVIASAPRGAHLYCCGPTKMIDAFVSLAAALPSDRVHVERFSNDQVLDKEGSFEVVLAKAGETIEIQSGQTILDALLGRGIDAPFSCTEGICSACEVKVLSGIPDHRDMILTKEQRAANDRIMICCSRSRSKTLVLDL